MCSCLSCAPNIFSNRTVSINVGIDILRLWDGHSGVMLVSNYVMFYFCRSWD